MIAAVALVALAAAAAAGLMLEAPAGLKILLIAGALGGLLAWDLAGLNRRLKLAAASDDLSAIRRRHLAWLGLAAGTGLLLASGAMLIPVQVSFGWIVVLALVVILGMAKLVSWLHQG